MCHDHSCGCWQVEGLEEVERAFVHVDYALRAEPEHKVSGLAAVVLSCCTYSSAHCVLPTVLQALVLATRLYQHVAW